MIDWEKEFDEEFEHYEIPIMTRDSLKAFLRKKLEENNKRLKEELRDKQEIIDLIPNKVFREMITDRGM